MSTKPTYEELEQQVSQLKEQIAILSNFEYQDSITQFISDLVAELPAMIHSIDSDGLIVSVSNIWLEKLGYAKKEVIGKKSIDFLTKESRYDAVNKYFPEFYSKGSVENIPYQFLKKDGGVLPVLLSAVAVFDKGGVHHQSLAIMTDITAQIKAEHEQINIKQSYEDAQRLASVGNWEIDLQSGQITWSDEVYRIFGLESGGEQLTYETLLTKVHQDDRSYHDAIYSLLQSEGMADFEYRLIRPNGEVRWVKGKGETVYSKNGEPARIYGALQDITERKRARKSLEDSNTDLRLAQHMAAIGNWHLDPEVGVPEWSDEVYRIYERDPNTGPLPFEDYKKIHPGKHWEEFHSHYRRAIREGEAYDIEVNAEFPDGKKKELHLLCEPGAKPGPKGYFLRGTIQDITVRKRLEDERLENEKRFQQLFNAALDLIFIQEFTKIGRPRKFIQVNESACIALEYSEKELLNMGPLDIMLESDNEEVVPQAAELFYRKRLLFEKNLITKTGKKIPVEVNSRMFEIEGKKYAISIARDITERKQAEEAIRESEENYRKLVELAQEGIWVIDKDGKTSFANPNMAKMLGYTPEEMQNLHIFDFMDEQGKIQAQEKLVRRQQGIAEQHDFEFLHRDGRKIYTAIATSPLFDKEGNYDGAIAGVLDITKRRKAELESRRLQARLAQSQKMESIGNLAGGIAHDFNNILSSILGFTELALNDAEKGSELDDCLQEVYAGGNRAKELVKQILAFARQTDEVTKPVQPSSIAREVLKLIRSTIPVSIEIEKHIETSSFVLGNPIQLHQVLLNILTNAAQAMKSKGGTLKVEMRDVVIDISKKWDRLHLEEGKYIELIISDTGEGIQKDVIEQIFEPYFTTKEPGEGSGMGLAVANGIIESYGGKILAESVPHEKTQFLIYLPIAQKLSQEQFYDAEKLPTGNERILFVDDEPPLARMGGKTLERLGYSVETRTSAVEALELFRTRPYAFDLVITDMTMPYMMGDKFALELQQIREDIPIILCTGYSALISEEKAREIGIRAFTYKPIAKVDLAKTIRQVLDE